jgi:iron complex outermembrane receptor protein
MNSARPTLAPTALAALLLMGTLAAQAQNAPPPAVTTNADAATGTTQTITVVARNPSRLAEVPASVSVLSAEQLERATSISSETLDALVKFVPGLATNNETGFDSGKGPLLRGRAASVLVNGVPVNTLLRSSGFTLGLVDSYAVDRVEVNRGSTAVYGFGAPGGIIGLQTRRGVSVEPEVTLRSSVSFNTQGERRDSLTSKLYTGIGQWRDGFDYHVGLAVGSEGVRYAANGAPVVSQVVKSYNLDATVGVALTPRARLEITLNHLRRNYDDEYIPPGYVVGACAGNDFDNCPPANLPPDPFAALKLFGNEVKEQYQQATVALARLTWTKGAHDLDVSAYSMDNRFRYGAPESSFEDPPTFFESRTSMRNERQGLRASVTSRLGSGDRQPTLTYGVDYQLDKLFRNLFGGQLGGPLEEDRPLAPPVELDSRALFLQTRLPVGRWLISAGARAEFFKPKSLGYAVGEFAWPRGDLPDFRKTTYNLGAVYAFSATREAYVSIAQGIEVTELGRALRPLAQPNVPADLSRLQAQPATTTQYELGLRSRTGALRWTAAAFYIDSKLSSQLICNLVSEPCVNLRQPERAWGFEGEIDLRVNARLDVGANVTWQNGSFDDEDGVRQRQNSGRVTPPRLVAYTLWRPAEGWTASLSVVHNFDRKPFEETGYVAFGTQRGNVDGFTLVDASIGREIGLGSLTVGVENLFNRKYVPVEFQHFRDIFFTGRGEGRRVTLSYSARF